jgi:hypothetical protein
LKKLGLWKAWAQHQNAAAKLLNEIEHTPRGRPRKLRAEAPGMPEAETETLQAAAVRWGVSEDTIRRDAQSGRIQTVKIRGRTLVVIASCRAAYLPR